MAFHFRFCSAVIGAAVALSSAAASAASHVASFALALASSIVPSLASGASWSVANQHPRSPMQLRRYGLA